MKITNIFIGLLIFSLTACSGDNLKSKMDKLADLKANLSQIKSEISDLKAEIKKEAGDEDITNVEAKVITPQTYNHFIKVTGKVKTDKNIIVSPEGGGKIMNILVKEGDNVKKGQTLAYLNNSSLDDQINQVKVNLGLAKTTFERQSKLWKRKIGSEMEYLRAKSNKESLEQNLNTLLSQKDMMSVKSQINGVVDEIFQRRGEIAGPSVPFARVVNIDNVYINAEVGENFLGTINKGDSTQIYFPSIKKTVNAKVFRSSTVINDISRTFRVRINLNNKSHAIRPNLLATVNMCVFSANNLIIIPSILVKQDFDGKFIFTAIKKDGKTIAKKQYIKQGFSADNRTIITDGLKFGDHVIVKGYDQIVDGTEIKLVK